MNELRKRNLPDHFQFSQSSLQDYVDCPRRFELRYLQQLAWPAVESEPMVRHEHQMQMGARFHRLVQQHLIGLPEELLTRTVQAPLLQDWWLNYLSSLPAGDTGDRFPETILSADLAGHRINARFDLLLLEPDGSALIFDWKTAAKRPKRIWLEQKLQTQVYRYVLAQSGAGFNNGKPLDPARIELVYWFPAFPEHPERFPYSQSAYSRDESYLTDLIQEIAGRKEGEFPLTGQERQCVYCRYRSLCDRGTGAGEMDDSFDYHKEDDFGIDLDLDQVGEIAF